MKKLKYAFVIMLVLLVSITQPVSVNLDYFNKAHAIEAETDEALSCTVPNTKEAKSKTKFKNNKVLNKLKKQLNNFNKEGMSYYKASEFQWNETIAMDYGNGEIALTVPLKDDMKEKDGVYRSVALLIAYNESNDEIGSSILLQADTTLDMKFGEITYRDLENEPIVGFKVDREEEIIEELNFDEQEASLLTLNTASAGYWNNVASCIKSYWPTLPGWVQTLCGTACYSIVFGGNIISVVGCASCGGSWLYACLLSS